MNDVTSTANELVEQFENRVNLDVEEVESELETLMDDYSIPLEEAKRVKRNDLEEMAGGAGFNPTPLEDIDTEGKWIDIRAEVIELWEKSHPNMVQVGLLGDETGTVKFTYWNDADITFEGDETELKEGETYHIEDVVTDEYKGRYSVKLTSQSSVRLADDDEVETPSNEAEFEGLLVDVKSRSGLIKRCPEEDCSRVLNSGRCSAHGEVEGEFDLRIKAYLDDGETAKNVVFGEEATTELTGISLEEAKEMAKDALDTSVVENKIRDLVVGSYLKVSGPEYDDNLFVDDATEQVERSEADLDVLRENLSTPETDLDAGSAADASA
jgi:replication factor A1